MDRSREVLLEVWREACRHVEIRQSVTALARLIRPQLPVETLLVREIDSKRGVIETVGAGHADGDPGSHRLERTPMPAAAIRRLLAWGKRSRLGRRSPDQRRETAWSDALPEGF